MISGERTTFGAEVSEQEQGMESSQMFWGAGLCVCVCVCVQKENRNRKTNQTDKNNEKQAVKTAQCQRSCEQFPGPVGHGVMSNEGSRKFYLL